MPKKPDWAKPKAPKAVKELFKAKKEVTVKDAKRLNNLVPFKLKELRDARVSDNLAVFMQGFSTAAIPLMFVIGYLLSV